MTVGAAANASPISIDLATDLQPELDSVTTTVYQPAVAFDSVAEVAPEIALEVLWPSYHW